MCRMLPLFAHAHDNAGFGMARLCQDDGQSREMHFYQKAMRSVWPQHVMEVLAVTC